MSNPVIDQAGGQVKRLLHPISDAAQVLGIGRSTLYKLIADGEIAVVKIGRRALITQDELERYVRHLVETRDKDDR